MEKITSRRVAFAIGVSDPEGLGYLPGAINSARQFYEWSLALGYNAHLIIDDWNPVTGERNPVTLDRLRKELLSELLTDPPISRLVIYFAGHGLIREVEEGLWLLSDWRTELRAVGIELLKRRLYRFNIGQIAIFSDSCRSLPPGVDEADLNPDAVLGNGPRRPIGLDVDKFLATQDGDPAYMLQGETPEEDFSLFSGVLMEGLWGLNQGAFSEILPMKVTSSSLGTFLRNEVPRRAAQYGQNILPSISPTFPEGSNIYFDKDTISITPPQLPPWPSAQPGTTTAELRKKTVQLREERKEAGSQLLSKMQNQSERHPGTGPGFAVEGAHVRNLWIPGDIEVIPRADWWQVRELRSRNELRRSTPILIEFEDGTFAPVTILPLFLATLINESRGIAALIYQHKYTPPEAASTAQKAIAQLESDALRADAATDLAAEIRQLKHFDPILGVISAYLYDSIGDIDSIRRMAYFYVIREQPIPYDIALLGRLRGEMRKDRDRYVSMLSAVVPQVSARKPRTLTEEKHDWTYSRTEEVEGEVGGFWPWLRQGWAFLDDYYDDRSDLVIPGLPELASNLTTARFATLDTLGGRQFISLVLRRLGPIMPHLI